MDKIQRLVQTAIHCSVLAQARVTARNCGNRDYLDNTELEMQSAVEELDAAASKCSEQEKQEARSLTNAHIP